MTLLPISVVALVASLNSAILGEPSVMAVLVILALINESLAMWARRPEGE